MQASLLVRQLYSSIDTLDEYCSRLEHHMESGNASRMSNLGCKLLQAIYKKKDG